MIVQTFRLSTAHVKFQQICTLIGSFCWKYIKVQLKKYRGVMSHDPEEWYNIWRKTDFLFQKWQEFGEFWPEHSKVSRICTLIGSYCAEYLMFDLKKLSSMTLKRDTKFEEKLICGLENDKNLANLHQSTENVKIGTLMGSFCSK